jgi:hypothetical protein
MENICKTCFESPGSHSFSYLCKTTNININEYVFYTCIANAKLYNDTNGILKHYSNYLEIMNPDLWIWIFNCDGFSMKHYFDIHTIRGLANLIKTYGKVKHIYIINITKLLYLVLKIVKPILDKEIYDKIQIINSNYELINLLDISDEDMIKVKELLN